ncbi:hypothetical protein [Pseudooctadecabacter jejudonensis]|uniref:Uncharacterized protein n=1 Tax=Pseudooctadecabacter jejudonensis TaxID=1391910 RepID=A0A1Y5SAT0_9RHOB|nr:hypothetical protein [Pseudooctadecabacter jejudonensis]SLN36453.1 hypothetical protein PSJ8397_01865 [Pseudooctadecabacter jejudonensis]
MSDQTPNASTSTSRTSVFWIIVVLFVAVALIMSVALIFLERNTTPTTGTANSSTEEVGPAATGVVDTTGAGLLEDEGVDSALENGAGANMGGDVQGSVATTDEAPDRGVTDTEPRVQGDVTPDIEN